MQEKCNQHVVDFHIEAERGRIALQDFEAWVREQTSDILLRRGVETIISEAAVGLILPLPQALAGD